VLYIFLKKLKLRVFYRIVLIQHCCILKKCLIVQKNTFAQAISKQANISGLSETTKSLTLNHVHLEIVTYKLVEHEEEKRLINIFLTIFYRLEDLILDDMLSTSPNIS
jgi:hypothetical protein